MEIVEAPIKKIQRKNKKAMTMEDIDYKTRHVEQHMAELKKKRKRVPSATEVGAFRFRTAERAVERGLKTPNVDVESVLSPNKSRKRQMLGEYAHDAVVSSPMIPAMKPSVILPPWGSPEARRHGQEPVQSAEREVLAPLPVYEQKKAQEWGGIGGWGLRDNLKTGKGAKQTTSSPLVVKRISRAAVERLSAKKCVKSHQRTPGSANMTKRRSRVISSSKRVNSKTRTGKHTKVVQDEKVSKHEQVGKYILKYVFMNSFEVISLFSCFLYL